MAALSKIMNAVKKKHTIKFLISSLKLSPKKLILFLMKIKSPVMKTYLDIIF